jgi:hypothetical protein
MAYIRSVRKRKNDLKQLRVIIKRNGPRCHDEGQWLLSIIQRYPVETWLLCNEFNPGFMQRAIARELDKTWDCGRAWLN